MEGTIVKGFSGFYYVNYHGQIYECSLRGKNRQRDVKFLPGDLVEFEALSEDKGVIERVRPRKNELTRPPIANVDQLVIVAAMHDPIPDFWLIDRLTVLAQWNNIVPVICFNKGDLVSAQKQAEIVAHYEPAEFQVVVCSTMGGWGVEELRRVLAGKISVFAGNSGVGKSSLMNSLNVNWDLGTGAVSGKLKRGKHTTRHVELFNLDAETLIADTPGFSSLQLPTDLKREELCRLFPEFMPLIGGCKFATCLHNSEPSCAVKEAVLENRIGEGRYKNYLDFLKEVIEEERSY